jgi:hypothetical protein
MKKKCYVLMVQPRFEGKIIFGKKKHSMRINYEFWKKRIESIMAGEGYLSLRVWTGKPRRSKQREFLQLEKAGIEKITLKHSETLDGHKTPPEFFIKEKLIDEDTLAENDGFEDSDELIEWFWDYSGDMALIYFTNFKYGGVTA